DARVANLLGGFVEFHSLLNQLTGALKQHESRMALVGVKHGRLNSERSKHAYTADTEHDLLANSMFLVTAVKACGKLTITVLVLFDIGIHEIQRHGTQIHAPHHDEHAQASDLQLNQKAILVVRAGGFDWSFV